jgi:hypothetical protein
MLIVSSPFFQGRALGPKHSGAVFWQRAKILPWYGNFLFSIPLENQENSSNASSNSTKKFNEYFA